jgi:lactoylglutathione lyase
MLTNVRSVGIYVSDQQRALDFFTEILGCELVSDQPMGADARWIEVRIPGDDTLLVLFAPDGQRDRVGTFSNVLFHCDDMQATYDELSSNGVVFTTKPELAPWGRWWAAFQDPDGNTYGLGLVSEN